MSSKLTFPFDPLHTKLINKGGIFAKLFDPLGVNEQFNPKPAPVPDAPPETDSEKGKRLIAARDDKKRRARSSPSTPLTPKSTLLG